ncbi:hypothetical protein DAPPUDRAFT_244219 [Daphnia pulex]|uniref:Uncharacterized protein n=1 Tax=Daphnia pulex TaxID=6669 RepID=E9GKG8_DAPPU|nr:hypothetical protein DAPPUDRAFT_244219 [Daphnia pulex]|eukprot:EFX79989.1 hypothetical protein DAPPUDRAFT_244219 [Daphnia pulex]
MGIQGKINFKQNSTQIQNQDGGERIYSVTRDRLQRNYLSGSEDGIPSHHPTSVSSAKSGYDTAGRIPGLDKHFNKFLKDFCLNTSSSDPCVYSCQQGEELSIMAIWGDDGFICSNKKESTTGILQHLSTHFEMRSSVVD